MLKNYYYESSEKAARKSFLGLLITTLLFLISFNLAWLSILIRISRLTEINNISRNIFNLELFLIIGNLTIVCLFATLILTIKKFNLPLNKHC
ncbi:hypothetical protein H1P_1030018 [Hyella patelloides LEGE 07179]|uniref:Uncharacterized protein n=1 Tax=Hyella patelloides LEGE 07179 TaxID=945734 RepID=A0A563VJ40_9CYAN|nr:hypothetical protein [Hyella patelloides]VEP11419.1 hypothetical protein H1P_1030018 [Hyella patelloides LEGE 07179]